MRLRRHHSDARSWPSGLAEVELFTFWENDLASDVPAGSTSVRLPAPEPDEDAERWQTDAGRASGPSAAPLWLAAGLVVLVLVIVLLS
jgi:hypothetical protein